MGGRQRGLVALSSDWWRADSELGTALYDLIVGMRICSLDRPLLEIHSVQGPRHTRCIRQAIRRKEFFPQNIFLEQTPD